jgi:MFS transporter, Spinster family, sphingosine-1-phosphate transporter
MERQKSRNKIMINKKSLAFGNEGVKLLVLLWFAFFLNQADRQIFSVVMPLIRKNLDMTDAQLGLVASVLIWSYGLLVPIAGFMGDKFSHRNIIGYALLFWSFSTLSTGFCNSLLQFILIRGVATGGSEAFYAPSANAMLSNKYSSNRAFVLSIHQTAVYVGIILSGIVAGFLGEKYGWQSAFYLFGGVGVLTAIIFFSMIKQEPVLQNTQATKESIGQIAGYIIRKPTVILLTLAFGCMVFVNSAYVTWMPSFLGEKFNLSLTQAGFSSLFYHHIGAFFGILMGAKISDRFAKTKPQSRLVVQALGLLFGAPFIYWMSIATDLFFTQLALFLFGIFRGWFDSNIVASLYEVIPEKIRSSAYGLMIMCAFLVGATSPIILGILKPIIGLSVGLSLISVMYLLGAGLIGIAILFFFKKDKVLG